MVGTSGPALVLPTGAASMNPAIDLAFVAAAMADPSRAIMLSALLDGAALPAGELAYRARVTGPTASAHLSRLMRSEEHTSELQALMRISYAVFCSKQKTTMTK